MFVRVTSATIAGAVYTAHPTGVPLYLMGKRLGHGVPNRILVGTFTDYAVLAYLCVALVVELVV